MADTLHVPQAKSSISRQSINDIMNAYNSQSKIQLYDDSSAMSNDDISGVGGRDIPLSALRPKAQKPKTFVDENGNLMQSVPSKTRLSEDVEAQRSIRQAYNRMRGIEEGESEGEEDGEYEEMIPRGGLSDVPRFKASYVEDMPEDDEGLLGILELAINNAKANLEMLQSLYAALSQ